MEKAPEPEISFTATIIDDQGVSTTIKDLTLDGRISLVGKGGKGIVTIPFEKVKKVSFIGEAKEGVKDARLTLQGEKR